MEGISSKTVIRYCAGIAALCLLVYGYSLWNGFVYWDDPILILENPISQGFTWTNIVAAFSHYDPELYVPFTFITYQLNYAVGGLQPFVYHLTNLVLHMGSAMLVGGIVQLLWKKPKVAVLTAVLFAVHPINVEAVAWAAARKDVLASFFFLVSLASYLYWKQSDRKWYVISLVAFLCGLLSKVSVLPLPVILLVIEWHEKRLSKKTLLPTLPYFGLSVIFGIVALLGKADTNGNLLQKILMAGRATLWTFGHLFLPIRYSVLYPYVAPIGLGSIDLLVCCAVVVALCIGAWMIRYKYRDVAFAWFWFLVLLAPSFMNIEKGGDITKDIYVTSDRYAYLACIAVFAVVALMLSRIKKNQAFIAVTAGLSLLLAALAFLQSLTWENTETLFRHSLKFYPDSNVAWNNIGSYADQLGRFDDAREAYEKSIALKESGNTWFNLGQLALRENRAEDAITYFQNAVRVRPSHAPAQQNLGALLMNRKDYQQALVHLLEAQKLDPSSVATYLNLGITLEKLGNELDARRAYEIALQLDPQNEYAKARIDALTK
jgi:Flp pilus assembly protein TadD